MEEKDDELQTNFGATRCSIWGLALVALGVTGGGGLTGGDRGIQWAQHYQQFLLIVQLVAGKH